MRIPVESIPRTGRTITLGLGAEWSREAAAAALEVEASSLSGALELSPPKRGLVVVLARIEAGAACMCHRCGERFDLAVALDSQLRYAPIRPATGDEEVELQEEELEIGWYDNDELDLGAIVQEAIALALPARYTCPDAEACDARTQALLDVSGADTGGGHPGFSVLKDLMH